MKDDGLDDYWPASLTDDFRPLEEEPLPLALRLSLAVLVAAFVVAVVMALKATGVI